MKVIYIAGPFRASSYWEQEQNIRRAEEWALEVWKLGAAVICPHTNTRFFQGAVPDNVWLEGDFELINRADALLMVPGWLRSSGALNEHDFARRSVIPIFYSLYELKQWLNQKD